jgi:GBP family porin
MKKTLIAPGIVMLLAVQGAWAQSSVEVYGIFDIGIGHSPHAPSEDAIYGAAMTPNAGKTFQSSVTGMFNGGLQASRIGFRGTEDMGDGLKAVFNLENGFQSPHGTIANSVGSLAANTSKTQTTVDGDGSLDGQLFNRQANVGLSSPVWGTVLAGRNYSLAQDVVNVYDPMDGSQVFSPIGYNGIYGGGGYSQNLRLDNSIRWKFNSKATGFNVGVLYKFGGQSGSTSAQSVYQATAGYENGPFGIQAAYVKAKDALQASSGASLGAVNVAAADTTAYMLAASYQWEALHLRGGYERENFNNPSNPTLDKGITSDMGYPIGVINVTPFNIERTFDVYFAGVNYNVSQRFSASVAYYQINQNDYSGGTCKTGTDVATCSGKNKFYSLLGDYALSKRTHLYAGFMLNRVSGGFASGFLYNSNNLLGLGIKHTF